MYSQGKALLNALDKSHISPGHFEMKFRFFTSISQDSGQFKRHYKHRAI
jgi:hypothetical protein